MNVTEPDVQLAEVLTNFLASFGLGGVLAIICVSAAMYILIKKNGYVKEAEFRSDMNDLKGMLKEQSEDTKAIRTKVQSLDRDMIETRTKLDGFIEQYRNK